MKNKVFKNNNRRNSEEKTAVYVPQYKQLGIEPIAFPIGKNTFLAGNPVSAQARPPLLSHSFMNDLKNASPDPNAKTWSTVDNQILINDMEEDYEEDYNEELVDNNKAYSAQSFGMKDEDDEREEVVKSEKNISSLKEEEYALFIDSKFISSGSLEEIEYQVNLILFGDVLDIVIDKEDIIVVKRIKLKVGAFLVKEGE